jgi:hypothetical protein
MSDSSIDEELFGGSDKEDEKIDNKNPEQKLTTKSHLKPPKYVDTLDFNRFIQDNKIMANFRYGYVCIFLYR